MSLATLTLILKTLASFTPFIVDLLKERLLGKDENGRVSLFQVLLLAVLCFVSYESVTLANEAAELRVANNEMKVERARSEAMYGQLVESNNACKASLNILQDDLKVVSGKRSELERLHQLLNSENDSNINKLSNMEKDLAVCLARVDGVSQRVLRSLDRFNDH